MLAVARTSRGHDFGATAITEVQCSFLLTFVFQCMQGREDIQVGDDQRLLMTLSSEVQRAMQSERASARFVVSCIYCR